MSELLVAVLTIPFELGILIKLAVAGISIFILSWI